MILDHHVAAICHEANRAFCIANGDHTQAHVDMAPDWQIKSALAGVRFLLKNPTASDSALHDHWVADKVADGWKYGPEKDAEAKTHPCIVAFEQLPPDQQAKDRLFKAVVASLASFTTPPTV